VRAWLLRAVAYEVAGPYGNTAAYIYMQTCMHIYAYIYIHICAYVQICIHMHIHT